ncbi:hypothetical protein KUTeg_014269 [Tegillarca granosa]|uniref:Uncharacterized protein n=1 Tax=Tegillarca granosa TaxID=220873 RepID=A0ABQ9EW21_TEGGR|nr:hypothetical protein KUTeg_014269 [Tegillarca granosa]
MAWIWVLLSLIPYVISAASWDLFIFAQEWPPAVCIQGEMEETFSQFTKKQKQPTLRGTEGPTSCNNSWHFSVKPIQVLFLHLYHVSYSFTLDRVSFREHEWDKHGTCATSLPTTADEHKYFSTALKINDNFNALKLLNKHGIIPSKTASYNHTKQHVIYEVEICLDKQTLKPVSCYPSENESGKRSVSVVEMLQKRHHHHSGPPQSDCPKSDPIYYPPIPGVDPELVGRRDIDVSVL